MKNLKNLASDFLSIAKETKYCWLSGLFAYGSLALNSEYKSDVVIICD